MLHLPPTMRFGATALARGGLLALVFLTAACSGRRQVIIMGPPVDANQVALRSESVTALEGPTRIVFDWAVREQGVNLSGQGVARVEPPYRARLDLFLSNGEAAARAAMVGDELRIPAGMPEGILPPSHLLWGTLGVFRPGLGSGLMGGDPLEGGGVLLKYRLPGGDEVHYALDPGRHIRSVEVLRTGTVIQRLEIERDERSFPREVVYRDLTSFRELRLTRSSVEQVEPFPPDIWLR